MLAALSNRTDQKMANEGWRRSGKQLAATRTSSIHGSGLFALRDIQSAEHIGAYEGRRYGPQVEREWDGGSVYVFRLSDGSVIDGADGGNESRHINHCCEPNCAAYEIESGDGSLGIVIKTLRSVQRGEELFLDYSLDADQADERAFSCACGASRCRGTMLRDVARFRHQGRWRPGSRLPRTARAGTANAPPPR